MRADRWGISLKKLYAVLGFSGSKLKAYTEGTFPQVACPDRLEGATTVVADVVILPTTRSSNSVRAYKHRVLIKCPTCGKMVPFGRWLQHEGTKSCQDRQRKLEHARLLKEAWETGTQARQEILGLPPVANKPANVLAAEEQLIRQNA